MDKDDLWNYEPVYFSKIRQEHALEYDTAERLHFARKKEQDNWYIFVAKFEDYLQLYPIYGE